MGGTSYTYADTISYTAAGQMTKERFGTTTNLYHNLHYNNRLQLVDIRLGDSSSDEWNWTRGALVFYYGTTARDSWNAFATTNTDNNGNLLRQVNYVPLSGGGNVIPQLDDYTYDALNRVGSVTEAQQNSSGTWSYNVTSQTFTYDRWGNRTSVTGQTAQSWSTTEAAATNRLKLASGNTCTGTKVGVCYDAAGNVIFDNQLGSGGDRTYDAEGRIITAGASGANKYVYDADGKRVRRQVGSSQYWQVYGIGGELVAEYQWNGTTATLQKEYGSGGEVSIVAENAATVWWLVKDHLGTPRMFADQTGSLGGMRRHDYYPFGEENFTGSLIRTTTNGYQTEGVRQKFTGYERDGETNLDYAQARYYANVQGRFTSVDPVHSSAALADPQSWNRYCYVGNHPTTLTDPTGLLWAYNSKTNEVKWFAGDELSQEQLNEGWKKIAVGAFGVTYVSAKGDLIWLSPNGPNRKGPGWRNLGYVGPRLDFQHGMGEDFAVWYAKFFFSNAVGGVVFRGVVTAYQAVRLMRVAQVAKGTGAFLEGAVEGGSGLGRLASLEVNVSQKGLNLIENHLNQFGEVPENIMMINRLKAAMEAGQKVSGADASFYMHEAAEATMMGQGMGYEAAHAASLAKYGVSQFSVYHPEVIQSVNALNSSFNSAWFKFWGIE